MSKKENYVERMKSSPLDLSPMNDESIDLQYGMKFLYPCRKMGFHTIESSIIVGEENVVVTVRKINDYDTDANKCMVKLIPDDTITYCIERLYSYELKKKIKQGIAKIIE